MAHEVVNITSVAVLGVLRWPNGADIGAELLRYDDLWAEAITLAHVA